jgi:hypothetical protein
MECNQNSQECQELSLYYWNFTNSTCNSSPASGNCGGGPDWTNYFSSGVTPAWDCSAAASATAAPPSKVTACKPEITISNTASVPVATRAAVHQYWLMLLVMDSR